MTSIRAIDPACAPPPPPKRLTAAQLAAFARDGLLFLPGLFDRAEIDLLRRRLAEADGALEAKRFYLLDTTGGRSEIIAWSGARDDLLGGWVRVARLVETAEDLLGGRGVVHWHSKLSFKAPGSAGRWDWHQDYGSWYREGCLRPDMLTATVALDPSDAENGCLKLLRGSHKMGRIDHPNVGEANAADPAVLEAALARLETVECDLAPGDGVFFHANTLHASGPNPSERPRTLLHVSYNAADNVPFRPMEFHRRASLAPLDDALLSDADRWGPLDVASLHRPERAPGERGVYGYQIEIKRTAAKA